MMDVKSAFLYGKIEEEVYVCQPPRFEDPDNPDRIYKVEKALYLSTYMLDNGFQRGKIDKTLFIKRHNDGEEVDVHMYRSMIGSLMYLTSSRPDIMFAVYVCARYQVNQKVWKSVEYGVSNELDTAYWGFLGVGTTFDIFQNIILIPYLEYAVLSPLDTAYWSLVFCGLFVSVGTDTPYLLDGYDSLFDVITQALEALKTSKPKVKGIVIQEPGKSTTTSITISSQQSQDKGKGILVEPVKPKKKDVQIRLDEETSKMLQAEFDEEERLAREKAEKEQEANIALIET
ncbi:putative ribonuclease H-like domain-containing protein [Tanacetum coccineum]